MLRIRAVKSARVASDNGDYVAIYVSLAIGLSVPSGSLKDCTTYAKVARAVGLLSELSHPRVMKQ